MIICWRLAPVTISWSNTITNKREPDGASRADRPLSTLLPAGVCENFHQQAVLSAENSPFSFLHILRIARSHVHFLRRMWQLRVEKYSVINHSHPQSHTRTHPSLAVPTGYVHVVGGVMWFDTVCFYTIRK